METQESSILDDLNTISKFYNSHRCIEITRELEGSTRNNEPLNRLQFLVDCNLLSTDINNEISITIRYIREIYSSISTDLESTFKTDPICCVMIIKSEEIMTANLFRDICEPLPEEKRMVDACDRVLALNWTKQKLNCFVERRMEILAPNLSAFVGLLLVCFAVFRKLGFAGVWKKNSREIEGLVSFGSGGRSSEGLDKGESVEDIGFQRKRQKTFKKLCDF